MGAAPATKELNMQRKSNPIFNVLIGALWVVLGVIAQTTGTGLRLFGFIPINGVVVMIIGVVWIVVSIFMWMKPAGQSAAMPGQMPPTAVPRYDPNQMPPVAPPNYGPGQMPPSQPNSI